MWNQHSTPSQPQTKPAASSSPLSAEKEPSWTRTPLEAKSDTADKGAAIGKSLVIKGEVSGSESLYIDGKVEGSIKLPGNRVIVGPNGQVAATITAREIVVQGKIVGNVNASDRLNVRCEGSLSGDVIAHRISIEDGAFFKGKIDIRHPGQPGETISPSSETRDPELPQDSDSRKMGYAEVR
jgi:cytoskeletal protein CcmA (bactofilin family)